MFYRGFPIALFFFTAKVNETSTVVINEHGNQDLHCNWIFQIAQEEPEEVCEKRVLIWNRSSNLGIRLSVGSFKAFFVSFNILAGSCSE